MPGYAVQWMEVEGPLYDESTGAGYRLLFGDLPMKRLEAGQTGVMLEVGAPRSRNGRRGGFGGRGRVAAEAEAAAADARTARSGRRSGDGESAAGRGAIAARRSCSAPIAGRWRKPMCNASSPCSTISSSRASALPNPCSRPTRRCSSSPGFLFVEEKPGRLDDYALASRLSYFLWNSEPDDALRALAARGELRRPEVLRAQTERLLNDPKSRRFVEAFTDYWLDLRKIDDTSPSTTLYNDYELDDPLKLAALEETRLFVAELLRADLPARNIVDSDFTFLNERLAEHYGMPGVQRREDAAR